MWIWEKSSCRGFYGKSDLMRRQRVLVQYELTLLLMQILYTSIPLYTSLYPFYTLYTPIYTLFIPSLYSIPSLYLYTSLHLSIPLYTLYTPIYMQDGSITLQIDYGHRPYNHPAQTEAAIVSSSSSLPFSSPLFYFSSARLLIPAISTSTTPSPSQPPLPL